MTYDDAEEVSIYDYSTAVPLNDVGGGDWKLIEAVRGCGSRRYWLFRPASDDNVTVTPPSHEKIGKLPEDIQTRLNAALGYWRYRCGVKAPTTGQRCRKKSVSGGPCHLHAPNRQQCRSD